MWNSWHGNCFMIKCVHTMSQHELDILSKFEYEKLKVKRDTISKLLNGGPLPESYANNLNRELGEIRHRIKKHYHANYHNNKRG